uniref:Uncharacterized protein n=1 Tax=Anguilla anguilla TaxID=7936 RepID=A0A0E9Q5I6_ANGAN
MLSDSPNLLVNVLVMASTEEVMTALSSHLPFSFSSS